MFLRKEAIDLIKEICSRYKNEPSPLMLILADVQKEYGYIPLEVQEIISNETNIPVSDIYGVVTFYSFFSLKPKGRYVIGVCIGTACYVKGGQNVLDKFSELLKIKPGQTTEDGLFTLDGLRCIGACGIAPAISINGRVYPKVKLSDICDVRDGTHDSPKYYETGYPLVTSKNLKNGIIDISNVKFISYKDYIKINERSKVNIGDVLFAMIGTIGNPTLVAEEPNYAIKNIALFKVPQQQSGALLKYILSSNVILREMHKKAKGSNQPFVSLKTVALCPKRI